jgi:hypothetical protein
VTERRSRKGDWKIKLFEWTSPSSKTHVSSLSSRAPRSQTLLLAGKVTRQAATFPRGFFQAFIQKRPAKHLSVGYLLVKQQACTIHVKWGDNGCIVKQKMHKTPTFTIQ